MVRFDDIPALVVGGSIAGTAAAIALARAGSAVRLVEPRTVMPDAGFGICLPAALLSDAIDRGFIDRRLPSIAITERLWITADGPSRRSRLLWRQRLPDAMHAFKWGQLWRALRDRLPADVELDPRALSTVARVPGGVEARFGDGTRATHPLAVGADGVDSAVRRSAFWDLRPTRAPYVAWRGVVAADTPSPALEPTRHGQGVTVVFDGGHLVAYPIPSRLAAGIVNWVLYASDGPHGFERAVGALPAEWTALIQEADRTPHAIGDLRTDRVAADGVLLVGDAAAVSRPHTASGATKALEDAFALHDAMLAHHTAADAAAAFDAHRSPAAGALVDLGRRLGRDQVENTPPWERMTEPDMAAWAAATVAGE